MPVLPKSLRFVISQWLPVFMHYGPPLTLFITVSALAALSYGLTQVYLGTNFVDSVNLADAVSVWGISGKPGAVLVADVFSIDVIGQTFSVHWSLAGGCGQAYTHASNDSCLQNGFMGDLALYLNENTTSTWNTTEPIGVFKVSAIENPPPVHYIKGRSMLPPQVFDTVIVMDPFLPYTNNKQESTLYYPFDQFSSFVSLLAINPADNSTVPISGVIGYGTVVSWNALGIFYPTTVGQETKYSVALFAWRQAMIRAFVILLVITNWLLSLAVLWMTWLVLFRADVDNGIILASTAILFAIPQIRASMPDAPPFGTFIDIGGYFLNVCLVSVCTSVLLFSQLRYRYLPPHTIPEILNQQECSQVINDDE